MKFFARPYSEYGKRFFLPIGKYFYEILTPNITNMNPKIIHIDSVLEISHQNILYFTRKANVEIVPFIIASVRYSEPKMA